MSITVGNDTYYYLSEVCQLAGISRSTLLRWMKTGALEDTLLRDRRGWRLFSGQDVTRISEEAHRVQSPWRFSCPTTSGTRKNEGEFTRANDHENRDIYPESEASGG